ncbi:hypothetical protein V6N12_030758 [Hibiscus sabdariffa]|uniref:Uncharacterized protein n=1 Tax=Hibiscus sabdariffa TaxID=183260 RepID=A0ABR2E7G5_9ROSI
MGSHKSRAILATGGEERESLSRVAEVDGRVHIGECVSNLSRDLTEHNESCLVSSVELKDLKADAGEGIRW